jgi:hypothetical protein
MLIESIPDIFHVEVTVGAQQAVPEGEDGAVVAVCIRLLPMMMHLVHIGRDHEVAERPVKPFRQSYIGMGECSGYYHQRLVDHHAIHGCTGDEYKQEEKHAAQEAIAGVMTKTRGHIHTVITMVYQVKPPERPALVHHEVYQPAAEVECQHTDEDRKQDAGIEPIDETELLLQAPIGKLDNENSEERVYDEVNDGEPEIHGSMVYFPAFVFQRKKGNSAFDDPEEEKAANKQRHALYRMLIQGREILKEIMPHMEADCSEKLRSKTGIVFGAGIDGDGRLKFIGAIEAMVCFLCSNGETAE